MPRPTGSAPCGSKSTRSTRRPCSARAAPRLMVVVVLPTPPFWLQTAATRAGPCVSRGSGSGKAGTGRPVGPSTPGLTSNVRNAATAYCTSPAVARMRVHLLDDLDVGAAVQEMGGETMAQRVRRYPGDPGPLRGSPQHRPGALPGEPPAAGVQEYRRAGGGPARRGGEGWPRPDQVVLQRLPRVAADRDDPLPAALSRQPDGRRPWR